MYKRWLAILILAGFPLAANAETSRVRIVRENSPAVVAINVLKDDGSTFTGTGFVITPDGLIATSRHVSDNSLFINITFNDGTVSGEAKIVANANMVDLSLLKIQAQNSPTVEVASSGNVQPGESITVIGNPRRLQNTVSSGLISQVRRKANGVIWHQISAPISPSSSGSPVFNREGKVISVAFASYPGENNQNLNFAVPSDYLRQLVTAAGYGLPPTAEERARLAAATKAEPENAFVRHIKKSWEILQRIFQRSGSKDLANTRA